MLRPSVLLVTLLVNAPIIWDALGRQTTSTDALLVRLLITLPIVALLLGGVRAALNPARAAPAARRQRADAATTELDAKRR